MKKENKLERKIKNESISNKMHFSFKYIILAFMLAMILAIGGFVFLVIQFHNFYVDCFDASRLSAEVAAHAENAYRMASISSIITIISLVVISILISCLCRYFQNSISRMLCQPIDELKTAANKLKNGELDVEITYASKDELGELAGDFREAFNNLQGIVGDSAVMLSAMANGNFSVDSQAEELYVGEFSGLLQCMRAINAELSGTLDNIKESSLQVEIGAQQLADSAQALAEGATDQAAAIEELTATIENITGIAVESAETAQVAATEMSKAETDARSSMDEMQELLAAMSRITETSKEIENIIGDIEDIASQTNLLALNASIEAARAGEAGRGFAVVADQIGKLAADSASSAVNTRELIGKSLLEVQNGNNITNKTADVIGKVVANMTDFAKAATGSAQASRAQADMLKQVVEGIDQISVVVQNNSATAQETSAVSEELLAQAEGLKEQVESFELGVN